MKGFLFQLATLKASHNYADFSCGSPPLDRYIKEQATQDIRRRIASCFVAVDANNRVAGYYTLASASVPLADFPPAVVKKLPRYPSVPSIRLGRLAVDQDFKGLGLGKALLGNATYRAANSEIASFALIVDAKDESAVAFYRYHDFLSLPGMPSTLFLPLAKFTFNQSGSNVLDQ
jgi:ribosomal protein S18 acetylase RimI-like enzyme